MGLITKEVEITCIPKNKNYLEEKGYNWKFHNIIKININDLSKQSHKEIEIQCDICKITIIKRSYRDHLKLMKNNPDYIYYCEHCFLEKIRKEFDDRDLILISKKYINCDEKLEFICKTHNKIGVQYVSYEKFLHRNQGCKLCGKINIKGRPSNLDFYYINFLFNIKDYMLLTDKYIDSKTKMPYICRKHSNNIQYVKAHQLIYNENCCEYCIKENNSGEKHWNWKGGETPLYEYLRHKLDQWKFDSLKNSDFKCVVTSKRATNKYKVHHLLSFHTILQKILDKYNIPRSKKLNEFINKELNIIEDDFLKEHDKLLGVCLHPEVHKLYHHLYSYLNNTPEQFDEFKIRYKFGEFDDILKNIK